MAMVDVDGICQLSTGLGFCGHLALSLHAYLLLALHTCRSTRSLRLSKTNLLYIPYVHTSFGTRSFISVVAPTVWSSLPTAPRMFTSPNTCHHLNTRYFQQAFSTHLAPSSCSSDSASADHCSHLQIIFTYLLCIK